MKKIFLLIIAFMLAACAMMPGNEFTQNRDKWKIAEVSHYRYDLFLGCFCAFRNEMPLTVEVKEGEVISITRADGTPVTAADSNLEIYHPYLTMDRLFSQLETDLAGGADEVTVTYDSTYGFPNEIAIDQIKAAVDDELSIQISNFTVLE